MLDRRKWLQQALVILAEQEQLWVVMRDNPDESAEHRRVAAELVGALQGTRDDLLHNLQVGMPAEEERAWVSDLVALFKRATG